MPVVAVLRPSVNVTINREALGSRTEERFSEYRYFVDSPLPTGVTASAPAPATDVRDRNQSDIRFLFKLLRLVGG